MRIFARYCSRLCVLTLIGLLGSWQHAYAQTTNVPPAIQIPQWLDGSGTERTAATTTERTWSMPARATERGTVAAASLRFQAQTLQWIVEFIPSANHDAVEHGATVVSRYELQVTRTGGTPTIINLQKPAPIDGKITVNVHANFIALPAGDYTGRLRAVGPAGEAWATVSATDPTVLDVPFVLAPSAPSSPGSTVTIQKRSQ